MVRISCSDSYIQGKGDILRKDQEESFLEPPPSLLTFSLWKQVGLCSSLGCLGVSLAQTLSLQG